MIRVDQPGAGFYRIKFRRHGHPVGIHIWFGAPHDPITGEELDRSPRWQALANDREIDLDRVWPSCASDPITEAEYQRLTALQTWGEENAPTGPQANPNRQVDLMTAPMPF